MHGSITKVLNATLVMQLVDEGHVELTARKVAIERVGKPARMWCGQSWVYGSAGARKAWCSRRPKRLEPTHVLGTGVCRGGRRLRVLS